jgi:N6-L-threonylcarbamoyladenine synthase
MENAIDARSRDRQLMRRDGRRRSCATVARRSRGVVASQTELHRRFGGVVPEIACRAHVENYPWAVDEALRRAGVALADLDGVAVTNQAGTRQRAARRVAAAKGIALGAGLPLVGVDHIVAHIHASFLAEGGGPGFPNVALVVSGGHTSLYLCRDERTHELLGATLDDAAARRSTRSRSSSAAVSRRAVDREGARTGGDRRSSPLPRTHPGADSLDFSFSGLKTAVLYRAFGQDAVPEARAREAESRGRARRRVASRPRSWTCSSTRRCSRRAADRRARRS